VGALPQRLPRSTSVGKRSRPAAERRTAGLPFTDPDGQVPDAALAAQGARCEGPNLPSDVQCASQHAERSEFCDSHGAHACVRLGLVAELEATPDPAELTHGTAVPSGTETVELQLQPQPLARELVDPSGSDRQQVVATEPTHEGCAFGSAQNWVYPVAAHGVADHSDPGQQATGCKGTGTCDEVRDGLGGTPPDAKLPETENVPGVSDVRRARRCRNRPIRVEYKPSRQSVCRSLVFPATIGAVPARALVDSGAEAMFVSQAFVRRHGLVTKPAVTPLCVVLADGSTHVADTAVSGAFRLDGFAYAGWELMVVPLAADHDIVIGMPWLHYHDPLISWKRGTMVIRTEAGAVVLQSNKTREKGHAELNLISAHRLLEGIRKETFQEVFLVLINTAEVAATRQKGELSAYAAAKIAEWETRFADVFHEDPPLVGTTQAEVKHRIELVPGAQPPPVRPPYRLSPSERAELPAHQTAGIGSHSSQFITLWCTCALCAEKERRDAHVYRLPRS